MAVYLIQQAKTTPVSLDEARNHLAIDETTRAEDDLIKMLIESATLDLETRTRRTLVDSVWEWSVDEGFLLGTEYSFPLAPVTKVQIFDLDEEVPEDGEPTDLSEKLVKVKYPSPLPQGSPLIGSLLPIDEFPTNYKVLLNAGYTVTEESVGEPIEPKPTNADGSINLDYELQIVNEKVTFATRFDEDGITPLADIIHLVFNRPVFTDDEVPFDINSFTIKDSLLTETKPTAVENSKGGISLIFPPNFLLNDSDLSLDFVGAGLVDEFGNYVDTIIGYMLPKVVILTEDDFIEPEPEPTEIKYTASTPPPLKTWIISRVGTLYSQRSEIALRAGKSNDALFDSRFVDILINAFKVEFV